VHALRNIAIALGLFSVIVVTVGLSLLITRLVLRPLGGEPHAAAAIALRVASGNFDGAIALARGDSLSLMAQLKHMQEKLAHTVSAVRLSSSGVATASAEIAQGNHDLSSRTESQASTLEQTAASMEELSATVRQNADSAHNASQLALQASAVAVQGGEVMGQMIGTMKGINDSSRKISEIIGVIDAIAFQTNILALNAAVEAARAGTEGRGFGVVASEVRSLAGRSASAAKEIKTLIAASEAQVEKGSDLVGRAGITMTEVVTAIQNVSGIVAAISAASNEQAQGVAQVGEAVAHMDQVTQQNAALVEQMAAAASSLQQQANELVQTMSVFSAGSPSQPEATQAVGSRHANQTLLAA